EIFLSTLAAAFQTFEDGVEIQLAPQADPYRDINLSVKHVLRLELLHQAIRDQFIIFGSSQVFGEGLESHQEPGEIFVLVKRFRLGKAAMFPVLAPEFDQGLRSDRSLEMQVQLSLRKRTDKSGSH